MIQSNPRCETGQSSRFLKIPGCRQRCKILQDVIISGEPFMMSLERDHDATQCRAVVPGSSSLARPVPSYLCAKPPSKFNTLDP